MSIDTNALVLVAIVKSPKDLEIARLLGWYRIPLRSSPKVVAVDYLAFYQTAAFKPNHWRIEFIAPVRGYELTTRADLLRDEADHPNARQEYYKIQVGQLVHLENPIVADRWKRITFLYTTGKYLNEAKTVSDLIIREEERMVVWSALRERSERQYLAEPINNSPLDIPPEALAYLLGIGTMVNKR